MDFFVDTKYSSNKTAVIFAVKLLVLYFLFSQANLLMNSVMEPRGRFHNVFISENLNYIQALKTALIKPAVWIIKLFGLYALHNEMDVMVVNGPILRVNYSCLGLGVMSFILAFVIAFPERLKAKLKLLGLGIIIIYLLNVLRISGLGVLMGHFESQRSNFNYHHEVFNAIVYLCIFALLYFWVKKNTNSNPPTSTTKDLEKSNEA